MKKRRKYTVVRVLITVLFIVGFITNNAIAAEIFWEPNSQELFLQERFLVTLWLDTQGADINAIAGTIVFPEDKLILQEVHNGNSIINFWIEQPAKAKVEKDGDTAKLIFSGVVPGGFKGEQGNLFSMLFTTVESGQGEVSVSNQEALLNDGFGTLTQLAADSYKFNITQELASGAGFIETEVDTEPPEPFVVDITQDETVFDNQYFLVFATQDKGTGIKNYEVLEISEGLTTEKVLEDPTLEWQSASVPYLLDDQNLESYIYVKAVDRRGNSRVQILPPRQQPSWYKVYSTPIVISAIIIIGIIIIYFIRRKRAIIHLVPDKG